MLEKHALVGTWQLQRFDIQFSDHREPLYPFGEEARGQLQYCADGRMSAFLCRAHGHSVEASSSSIEKARQLTEQEKLRAFDDCLAYTGRYVIDGDTVTHHVELALMPGLEGHEHRRQAVLEEPILTLSYQRQARSGVTRRYTLKWRRARGETQQ